MIYFTLSVALALWLNVVAQVSAEAQMPLSTRLRQLSMKAFNQCTFKSHERCANLKERTVKGETALKDYIAAIRNRFVEKKLPKGTHRLERSYNRMVRRHWKRTLAKYEGDAPTYKSLAQLVPDSCNDDPGIKAKGAPVMAVKKQSSFSALQVESSQYTGSTSGGADSEVVTAAELAAEKAEESTVESLSSADSISLRGGALVQEWSEEDHDPSVGDYSFLEEEVQQVSNLEVYKKRAVRRIRNHYRKIRKKYRMGAVPKWQRRWIRKATELRTNYIWSSRHLSELIVESIYEARESLDEAVVDLEVVDEKKSYSEASIRYETQHLTKLQELLKTLAGADSGYADKLEGKAKSKMDSIEKGIAEAKEEKTVLDGEFKDLLKAYSNAEASACNMKKMRAQFSKLRTVYRDYHISDCQVTEWLHKGDCSQQCKPDGSTKPGKAKWTRHMTVAQSGKGHKCLPLEKEVECGFEPCKVDCEQSSTPKSTPCSKKCGGGTLLKFREIVKFGENFGKMCNYADGFSVETCNSQVCSVPCVLDLWSNWDDECSIKCGKCVKTRHREIKTKAVGNGQCPKPLDKERLETKACKPKACDVDCVLESEWSEWGACTAKCDGGVSTRTKGVKTPAKGNGQCPKALAPERAESRACNTQACDVPCQLDKWSEWSVCSKKCGGGTQSRSRAIKIPARGNGVCNPNRIQTRECNQLACKPKKSKVLQCDAKVDVGVLWDVSGSLGTKGFKASRQMVAMLAEAILSTKRAQLAVTAFSGPRTWYNWYLCIGRIPGKKSGPS